MTDVSSASTFTPNTLTEVRGDLVLAALCVGQFRAPCQIDSERLLVQTDEALMQALRALGLSLRAVVEPFTPAPLFAPEQTILGQVARGTSRRGVHMYVSHHHEEDAPDESLSPSANA